MSYGVFAVSLVVAAALLALWADARRPRRQLNMRTIVGHAIIALAFLHVIPVGADSAVAAYASVFGLVLPALVYVCLTAVWFIRLAQSSLGGSVR